VKVRLGSHKKKHLISEINMVPFIDVVLVLLIIFMILSPFIGQAQIPVQLPRAASVSAGDNDNPLHLRITKAGDYYIGDTRVLRNKLEAQLTLTLKKTPQRAVLIEADRDVSFKNVVLALDVTQKLKTPKVGVAVLTTDPTSETKDREKR